MENDRLVLILLFFLFLKLCVQSPRQLCLSRNTTLMLAGSTCQSDSLLNDLWNFFPFNTAISKGRFFKPYL